MIQFDRDDPQPLYLQICDSLRQAIVRRQVAPGVRLPSTRDVADQLGVSRNTVVNAFAQLQAEGYLETREKSGTYVTRQLPEAWFNVSESPVQANVHGGERKLSQRGKRLVGTTPQQTRKGNPHNIFTNGVPALDLFPFDVWARLTGRQYRYAPLSLFEEVNHPAGYYPLRQAITDYLKSARGVRCEPEQVIITSGSQQAYYIAAAMLVDPGDRVWVEDPGCLGPRAAFVSHDAELVAVPVDENGVDVDAGMALAPDARVVCVSPSHQYPLGRTLSLSRRHRLLDWVNIADAWIVEDDYDCEYRYQGRPLVSLQGLDTHDRVIYIGTFSKILFPGLRIGYMVVPPDLAQPFTNARAAMDKYVHIVNQIVLHEFMAEGYFSRHIRQMRAVYDERRQLCLDALAAELDGRLELGPSEAGMHVCGHMPPTISDRAVARCAEQRGIEVLPLSEFYLGETPHNGLILGYTGIQPERIRGGVEKLAQAIEDASTIF